MLVPAAAQRRHVLIDRHDQVQPAQVLVADADRAALRRAAARPRRSPAASTRSACSRSIVVKLTSVTDGTARARMFGNTGAPACVGDRLTLICRRFARSVVLPADSSAFASARSGTRSKKRPALPRTTVRRDVERRPREARRAARRCSCRCRSSPGTAGRSAARVQRQPRADLPLVLRVEPDVRVRLRRPRSCRTSA